MTRIRDLSRKDSMNDGDILPVYDIKNGSTRSISFANLRAAVPYLESVEYSVPNLILTQSDGDQFTIDISSASDIIDDTVTSGSVVKWDADQELFTYAGATVDPDTGIWTFDNTIEVPSGSLFVSDTLSISEATYELFVHEHVTEQNAIGIQSVLDDTGSYQPFINAAGDQFTSTAQSEFDTTITTNPLVLPLASSSNIQTNVFRLKTAAAMTNFRMKLVDDDSGVVIKYIPSKIAVESGEGGLDLPAGDIEINLNSEAEDTSDTFNFGFTPLRSIEARATTLTIEADSIQLLGNSSGVPYVQNELQKLFQLNIPYIFDTSNIEDNYSRLNAGYVTESGTTGGLVVNYEATSTKDTVTTQLFNEGVDGSANPFVTTDGSDTFATSDIIQITGSKFNNGFYEVLSHSGTTLTIRGVGVTATVEDFSRDQWLEVTDSAAITKINVNVLRSSDTGVWQTGSGSTTPITYTDVDTVTYTGGDGIDITSEEISIDLAQAIAAGDLVLSNQVIGSFDGTYTPATVSGYLDASRNFVEDSSYKVFKRDAGGGQYYTIFWELLTFNEWYIAVSTIDPDTWTDGNATGVIQAGEYGLTTDSETQDGQNVPAADSNISYTTEVLTSFLDFNDDGQIFVDALDEDDMASDSATQLATQQSIKAYVDSQSGTDYTGGDGIDIDGSDVISVDLVTTTSVPNVDAVVIYKADNDSDYYGTGENYFSDPTFDWVVMPTKGLILYTDSDTIELDTESDASIRCLYSREDPNNPGTYQLCGRYQIGGTLFGWYLFDGLTIDPTTVTTDGQTFGDHDTDEDYLMSSSTTTVNGFEIPAGINDGVWDTSSPDETSNFAYRNRTDSGSADEYDSAWTNGFEKLAYKGYLTTSGNDLVFNGFSGYSLYSKDNSDGTYSIFGLIGISGSWYSHIDLTTDPSGLNPGDGDTIFTYASAASGFRDIATTSSITDGNGDTAPSDSFGDIELEDGDNIPVYGFLNFESGQLNVKAGTVSNANDDEMVSAANIKEYVDNSASGVTAGDGIDVTSEVISVDPISTGNDGDRDLYLTQGTYEGVYTKSTFEGYISSAGVVTEDSSYVIYRRSQNDGTYAVVVWENDGSDWDVYTTSTNPDDWVDGGASGVGTPQLVTTQTQVYQSQNYPSSDDADVDYYVRQVGSFLAFDVGGELLVSVLDEDDLDSDSPDHVPTQQSVKAYVDNSASGVIAGDGIDVTSEIISIDVAEAVPENRLVLSDMAVNAANGVYEIAAFSGEVNSTNGNAIENSNYRVYKKRQSNGDYYAVYYEASPSAEWVATNCGNNDPDTWADGEGTGTFGETAYLVTQSDDTQDGQFVPTAADDNVDYTSAVASGFIHFTQTDREAYIAVLDEDDMTSDSDTNVPTQQSVKAYVDQSAPNIYNTDGTLTGDREIFGTDGSYFAIDVADGTQTTFVNRCLFSLLPTSSPRVDLYYVQGNGLGTDSDLVGFELSDTGTVYTDQLNTKPPELAADYSANETDRSLVDRGSVNQSLLDYPVSTGSSTDLDMFISGMPNTDYDGVYTRSSFEGYFTQSPFEVTSFANYLVFKKGFGDGTYQVLVFDDDDASWQAVTTNEDPNDWVSGTDGGIQSSPSPELVTSLSKIIDGLDFPSDTDNNVEYYTQKVGSFLSFDENNNILVSVLDQDGMESDSPFHVPTQSSVKAYVDAGGDTVLAYTRSGVDQTVTTGNGNDSFTIPATGSGAVDSPTFRFDNGWRVGNDEILSIGRDTPLRFDDGNVFSDVMTIQYNSSSGGYNQFDFLDVRTLFDSVRNFEWNLADDTANSQWRVFDSSASEILNLQRDGSLTLADVIYANRSYIQYSNGSDTSTNLNTGSAAAIPIFNADEESNNGNGDFTINSSTQAEVNFTGKIKIGYTFTSVISDGAGRVSIIGRVAINGTATGPESRCYIRGSDGCNEGTNQIHPIYIDVTDGDTIEITSQRGGTITSTATFNTTNQNYVTVERVS